MADEEKQAPAEVDADTLRTLEDQSEPAIAKHRQSPQQVPGSPRPAGGTAHEQDD